MYVFVCVCMHVCMYVPVVSEYVEVLTQKKVLCVCVCMYLCVCMYVCVHVCIYMYLCVQNEDVLAKKRCFVYVCVCVYVPS